MSERNNNNFLLQLAAAQQKIASLENELKENDLVILENQKLKDELNEKKKQIDEMLLEFESKIVQNAILNKTWMTKIEQGVARNKQIPNRKYVNNKIAIHKKKNDALKGHLKSLEIAYSDICKKYEHSKLKIWCYERNQNRLIRRNQRLQDALKHDKFRFEHLKSYAIDFTKAKNEDHFELKTVYEPKIEQLKGIIKRLEIKCVAILDNYHQKCQECADLSALCEESLGKWKKN